MHLHFEHVLHSTCECIFVHACSCVLYCKCLCLQAYICLWFWTDVFVCLRLFMFQHLPCCSSLCVWSLWLITVFRACKGFCEFSELPVQSRVFASPSFFAFPLFVLPSFTFNLMFSSFSPLIFSFSPFYPAPFSLVSFPASRCLILSLLPLRFLLTFLHPKFLLGY